MLSIIFWVTIIIIAYTFTGYPALLWCFNHINKKKPLQNNTPLPSVTLIIPAYNEAEVIDNKIKNSLELSYPESELEILVITDGSTDETPLRAGKHAGVTVHHNPERRGKAHAMNRAARLAKNSILVYSDANTLLNTQAIRALAIYFENSKIGCVAGEKRIITGTKNHAIHSGEGLYWRWESFLKNEEALFGSTMGVAGELFAVRKNLMPQLEEDTILDDFMLSIRIALKGKRIGYSPNAIACEYGSASQRDEWERKTRIAAGAYQSMARLPLAKMLVKQPLLFWQLASHKLLRWTAIPWLLPVAFLLNIVLYYHTPQYIIYNITLLLQAAFWLMGLLSLPLQNQKTRARWIFFPGYFIMMNAAILRGACRYFRKKQSALWQRVQRSNGMLFY